MTVQLLYDITRRGCPLVCYARAAEFEFAYELPNETVKALERAFIVMAASFARALCR